MQGVLIEDRVSPARVHSFTVLHLFLWFIVAHDTFCIANASKSAALCNSVITVDIKIDLSVV